MRGFYSLTISIFPHPYYIDSLIHKLASNNPYNKLYIFSEEFTRLFVKVKNLWNYNQFNGNQCLDMSEHLNNEECGIIYNTIYFYCKYFYEDNFKNNIKFDNVPLESFYKQFESKCNTNSFDELDKFDMSFLHPSYNKYKNNRFEIIYKNDIITQDGTNTKTTNYNKLTLFETCTSYSIIHTNYNLFDETCIKTLPAFCLRAIQPTTPLALNPLK